MQIEIKMVDYYQQDQSGVIFFCITKQIEMLPNVNISIKQNVVVKYFSADLKKYPHFQKEKIE